MDDLTFQNNLDHCLSQEGSAVALSRHCGITQEYVSNLRTGRKTNPSHKIVTRIADALDVNVIHLTCMDCEDFQRRYKPEKIFKRLMKNTIDAS